MSTDNTDDTGEQGGKTTPEGGILPGDDDCTLERFVRNRYFHGKLMTARDMQLEQEYHADRLETLAQHVTGKGAVCGLSTSVTQESEDAPLEVHVKRGYALDCCGRPVLLDDGDKELFPPGGEDDDLPPPGADAPEGELPPGVAVYVRLKECHTEKVPVSGSEDACREDCTYNRVVEDFEITIDRSPPDPKSVGRVTFPERDDLGTYEEDSGPAATDPELQTPARSYYTDEETEDGDGTGHRACDHEGDPTVFLGYYARRSETEWELLEEAAPRHYVYTNDMLYAAIVRHATDFGNPHDVVTSVDGVDHIDGDVDLESPDGSIDIEPVTNEGLVTLEVSGSVRNEALAEYVRDKTLKYTIKAYYEVAAQYAIETDAAQPLLTRAPVENEMANEVNLRARAILLVAREALAEAFFEDEFEFAAVVAFLASLEREIREVIAESVDEERPLATDESFEYYSNVLQELIDLLPEEFQEDERFEELKNRLLELVAAGDLQDEFWTQFQQAIQELAEELRAEYAEELDVTLLAVAQDQVAEGAAWLEPPTEPTMVLPGGEQEVDARIIRTAIDLRGSTSEPRNVSLDGGLSPYTIGETVDITGSTSGDVDEVVVLARDRDDWHVVELDGEITIGVERDGTFGVSDVSLSEGDADGNEVLTQQGAYRLGVIDADDMPGDIDTGTSVSASEFRSATTDSQSLRVVEPRAEISLQEPSGEIFIEQPVDFRGTTSGDIGKVAIFARYPDRGDWQIVELGGDFVIEVESDGTFGVSDVTLDDGAGGGNDIFAEPGQFQIGAIDLADVPEVYPEATIPADDFREGTSDSEEITLFVSR